MAADLHLAPLLALQEIDTRVESLHHRLLSLPVEAQEYENRIVLQNQRLEDAKKTYRDLELRRKDCETRTAAAEEQMVKYKTQQMAVKKNEEYKALQTEIDHTVEAISKLEDEGLEILLRLDEQKLTVESVTADSQEQIRELRILVSRLHTQIAELKKQRAESERALVEAENLCPAAAMTVYRSVKSRVRRPPYLVPLIEHRCNGCHLKVSNETEDLSRRPGEFARCENCGRLVYRPVGTGALA